MTGWRARLERAGWIKRGKRPSLWFCLLMLPIVARCKLVGWRRDHWGRLYRRTKADDPCSTLFHGSTDIWFDGRHPGGERAITWSYWHALLLDVGAWHLFIGETA